MTTRQIVKQVTKELKQNATKARAEFEKGYLKSDLEFLGATVPNTTKAAKSLWKQIKPSSRKEVWEICDALWDQEVHELRGVALSILARAPEFVTKSDLPRLKRWVVESNGWAHVDTIGVHILGPLVTRDPTAFQTMDKWATDKVFWVRRAAMLSMLLQLRTGDLTEWKRFVRYAAPQLTEKEFFIRKAIGWVLRETSKKEPRPVFEFLAQHQATVSGLTLREGAKYLSATQRKKLGL